MIDLIQRGKQVAQHLKRQPIGTVGTIPPGGYTGQLPVPVMPDDRAGAGVWVEWIAGQVPMLPADKLYVRGKLTNLPRTAISKTAKRYVHLWQKYAQAEPAGHRKQNAGRTAANRSLLQLVG